MSVFSYIGETFVLSAHVESIHKFNRGFLQFNAKITFIHYRKIVRYHNNNFLIFILYK